MNAQQLARVSNGGGFIAALDQSGGSTPKALLAYGIQPDAYATDAEMFDLIHEMRTRIMTSSSFDGTRVMGAILFEDTMNRTIDGLPTPTYLWDVKGVVPFLKVDRGLEEDSDGAQVMKPIPNLDELLHHAGDKDVFGTKMRSVIKLANPTGVDAVADQQFAVATQILDAGLIPIIEPEIDIHSPEKAGAESLLKSAILRNLETISEDRQIMLKLTLPDKDNFYSDLVHHPKVLKVVALSGGYTRADANARLARNNGVVASFSRALAEGLSALQSAADFDATLDASVGAINEASMAG